MSLEKVSAADHVQGSANAPVTLVEYGDYQCPYCGQAYPIVKRVQQELGDKLRFVFRNYPLPDLHPHALHAALASEAAGQQGKFWEMHDLLFEQQRQLDDASLLRYAQEIGLDVKKFEADFATKTVQEKVKADIASGDAVEIDSVPTFFINGTFFDGNYTGTGLLNAIQKVL
ncbi:MAG: DsbA family protein [Candidatus Symbiothrix sp.]|nr:DsbA family protein [Candidatus Symbiothrix sp.]